MEALARVRVQAVGVDGELVLGRETGERDARVVERRERDDRLPLRVMERTSRAIRSMNVSAPSIAVNRTTVVDEKTSGPLVRSSVDVVGLRVDDVAALLRFDAGEVLSRHCDAPRGSGSD